MAPSEDRQCCLVHSEVQVTLLATKDTESCGCIGITLSTAHMLCVLLMLLITDATNVQLGHSQMTKSDVLAENSLLLQLLNLLSLWCSSEEAFTCMA